MIVESKSLCSNSKVMAKAAQTSATNSHKRSNRKFGKQVRVEGGGREDNGSVYNGTSQGAEHILHAEAEQSEQKIESALYIYVSCFCLPSVKSKAAKNSAERRKTRRENSTKKHSSLANVNGNAAKMQQCRN